MASIISSIFLSNPRENANVHVIAHTLATDQPFATESTDQWKGGRIAPASHIQHVLVFRDVIAQVYYFLEEATTTTTRNTVSSIKI
jgi:hypothetical protein